MTQQLFKELLGIGENETLDFKETHYFSNNGDSKKVKDIDFVKDVLSMTNTVRDENAYIIIGVKEVDGKYIPVGINESDSIDSVSLQQKIRDKTNPIPKFSVYPFIDSNGLRFDIIEFPISHYNTICVPTVTYGGLLERGQVYIRRGSMNDKATVDELLKLEAWFKSLPKLEQLNSMVKKPTKHSIKSFQFDEVTIQKMFGNEAAEDEDIERLKEYYFKNDIYNKINVNLPLRILVGHKGIGKSALFKIAMSEDIENNRIPIVIKPDDVANIAKEKKDFSDLIRNWKEGLYAIILKKVLASFGIVKNLIIDYEYIEENIVKEIVTILQTEVDEGYVTTINAERIKKFCEKPLINIYIDDLDRGWLGGKADINRISALLNAVRDIINSDRTFQFKISLRSDVYFLVRTSDESTDKFQSSVIWFKWTYHEILVLMVKRILTYFNTQFDETYLRTAHQGDIAKYLNAIMSPVFAGKGRWENRAIHGVILSVIRKRPRDMVKLLTLAARKANSRGSSYITTIDFQAIFDEYSLDRIQDTINEYKSELPAIERLLFGMKPQLKSIKTSANFYFDTAALLIKINKIRERGEFKFANGQLANAKELAAFLYKINFISATKRLENGDVHRKEFEENRYLVSLFEDFGYDWEIHMAYRWGLQPSSEEGIYNTPATDSF